MMRIESKKVGDKGVFIHTKISPKVYKTITKIAKENKATRAATINELLKRALTPDDNNGPE